MNRLRILEERINFFLREFFESPLFLGFLFIIILGGSVLLLLKHQTYLTSSPGIIFAIFIGLFTVAGFFYTWKSIKSSYYLSQIITFQDFLNRIEELIKGLESAKGEGPLKIVCYSPAIGNLSLPKAAKKVQQALNELMDKKEKLDLEIVCLQDAIDPEYENELQTLQSNFESFNFDQASWWEQNNFKELVKLLKEKSALFKFYLSYGIVLKDKYGPRPNGENRSFLEAYKEASSLLIKLMQKARVYPKKEDNLPHFHLFFNRIRGILYVPVNIFPFYIDQPRWFDGSINYDKITELTKGTSSPVQLLGFETTDKSLLLRFEEFFEFCRTCLK